MKKNAFLIGLFGIACALSPASTWASTISEQELLLRNTLGVGRTGEVVVVTLRELGVTPEAEKKIRDVQAVDESGRALVCQYDDFGTAGNFSPEIAFEADLAPYESRRLTLKFLDTPPASSGACSVRLEGETAVVTTPEFTAPVRNGGKSGLWVEQPRLAVPEQKRAADAMDALLNEPTGSRPTEALGGKRSGEAMKPPMSEQGLPFCVQGYPAFDGKGAMKAWSGAVRAVVGLADRGTWATGHSNVVCTSLQTVWFPRRGREFHLDWRAAFGTPAPAGRIDFAGLRVNSADAPWDLIMGQDGRAPLVAPVIIPLTKTGKQPYLEGYQKSTFNHAWAQAVSGRGWAAVLVDTVNSRFGAATNWGSGQVRLAVNMGFSDPGPFENSLQPEARMTGLPAGPDYRLRAMVIFAGPDDPLAVLRRAGRGFGYRWRDEKGIVAAIDVMREASARFSAPLVVLPQTAAAVSEPDWSRIRALAAGKSVMVVTPDVPAPDRSALWARLADQLGGTWRPSRSFLQFFNVTSQGRRDKSLLTVVVGEPGTNLLLDQMTRAQGLVDAYPLSPVRSVATLLDETDTEGPLLILAGNTEAGTEKAVAQALEKLGPRPAREPVTLAGVDWAERMPYPWSGLKPHEGAFTATAYRNGHADFLFLLRANQAVTNLAFSGPAGAVSRFVPFRFESAQSGETRVVPLHDASFAAIPAALPANGLAAVWVSLKIPRDATPGIRKESATLSFEGGSRTVELAAEILPVELPDHAALGFYPLGFDAEAVRQYYGWDEETYLQKIPGLLRELKEFGVNTYTLEVTGLKVSADEQGRVTVDSSGMKRELEAVRSAGSVDLLFTDSLNYLWNKAALAKVMRARKLADDFEAFEVVIPEIRNALKDLGLEDQLVCRHGDEISDYENWRGRAELYKRCGVRMSVAINGYGVSAKRLGVGTMGLWIPLYNFYLNRWGYPIADDDPEHFSKAFRGERHAAGEPIWPYVCGPGPYAWSPRPRSQARFLMLDTYMKGADGLTYYGGMVWCQALDPAFRKSVKADLFDMDATFTTLFYPDAASGSILPSLRAGSFRLGLEDAGAVKALRDRAAAKGKAAEVEAGIGKAYAALTMDSSQNEFEAFRKAMATLWAGLLD